MYVYTPYMQCSYFDVDTKLVCMLTNIYFVLVDVDTRVKSSKHFEVHLTCICTCFRCCIIIIIFIIIENMLVTTLAGHALMFFTGVKVRWHDQDLTEVLLLPRQPFHLR